MKRAMGPFALVAGILVVGGAGLVVLMVFRVGVTRPTAYELHSGTVAGCRSAMRILVVHLLQLVLCFELFASLLTGTAVRQTPCRGAGTTNELRIWKLTAQEGPINPFWPLGHSDQRKLVLGFVGTEEEFRASQPPPLR